MNGNSSTNNDRKVTASCRVLPEQKLILTERAEKMGMSLAQYMEAKILCKDVFPLEKKIEEQRVKIESLKAKLFRMERDKNEELSEVKTKYKEKVRVLEEQAHALVEVNASSLSLQFANSNYQNYFIRRVNALREKYQLNSDLSALEMCLNYTLENDGSFFFLKRVSEFYNDNYKS